ncbi:MAG: RNA polymerase sigma factor [Clostridia bacterium]|nr:RNA polymerase sigma factor [Clostridia bacterium]
MEDERLIRLYLERDEAALEETARKYGNYLHSIAFGILRDAADAEECVNDALLRAWESIPPMEPENPAAYFGKLTRTAALNMYAVSRAQKRGGGETEAALDELEGCIPAKNGDAAESLALRDALDRFLSGLGEESRIIFLQRYWYFRTVAEIASELGVSQSKVKSSLFRTRNKLKAYLEEEGLFV